MSIAYKMTEEGVGAQYQRIIGMLGVAKNHGLKFIHNKITVGHNYNNDPRWDEKWDEIFNIKSIKSIVEIDDENTRTNKQIVNLHSISINDIDIIIKNPDNIFSLQHPFDIVDIANAPKYYNIIQNDIREAYNNKSQTYLFDKEKINIAIHIRVINDYDDIWEHEKYEKFQGRFTIYPEHYIMLITKLKNIYPNNNIHIFSQKNFFVKFKDIEKLDNIKFHIDIDSMTSFHHMCNADILVMSHSAFSYLAAVYNKNKVIYFPWKVRHLPLDTWEYAGEYIEYKI
jgi:hypothetical protein